MQSVRSVTASQLCSTYAAAMTSTVEKDRLLASQLVGIETKPGQSQHETGDANTVEDGLPPEGCQDECGHSGPDRHTHLVSCKRDRDDPGAFPNSKPARNGGCACGDQWGLC